MKLASAFARLFRPKSLTIDEQHERYYRELGRKAYLAERQAEQVDWNSAIEQERKLRTALACARLEQDRAMRQRLIGNAYAKKREAAKRGLAR